MRKIAAWTSNLSRDLRMKRVSMPLEQLTIVLVRTRNPLNIGAVARAMQNFGVGELRVVAPFAAAFREARSAVGAYGVLAAAREFPSLAEAIADCRLVVGTTAGRRRELQQPLIELTQAAATMRAALAECSAWSGRVALLFGSEKHGLTREDLERCHWLLRIPTAPEQPSMNLGQAMAVCLWELTRTQPAATSSPASALSIDIAPHAPSGDLERLAVLLLALLDAARYSHPQTQAVTESQVRRMLHRLHVTDADTYLLMRMARKLLWRLQSLDRLSE